MAFGFNVKILSKIPAFIKKSIEDFKSDLEEVKEAVTQLKAEMPKMKQYGTKCAESEITDAPKCYRLIYGPITYT